MRAARSDSLRMISSPRRTVGSSEAFLGESLGPAEDRGERIVQLVRDAGHRLAERSHLLGLQQLVVDVACLSSSFFRSLTSRTSASTRTPPSAAVSARAVTSTQTGA